mmetsp:Transcript_13933/g.31374  ORF Transcript_13933/g.31374 Transcript_13933/m.31374 type:complete len:330 (+) Transcript_13933:48-1037(+)
MYLAVPLLLAAPPAPTIKLRNGVEMPMAAAGVYQYNSTEAYTSVSAALKVGFRLLDNALDYLNQDGVGKAIKDSGIPRSEIFIETKIPGCGNPLDPAKASSNWFTCYQDSQKNLQTNLNQLGVDYVDLVIIHFPPMPSFITRSCNDWSGGCAMARAQWRAMEEFYKAGKARSIGVSNYCQSCFECLNNATVFPMVNQLMYHVGMGVDPKGLMSYGAERGVVTQAYSALGNTPWGGHASKDILAGNLTTAVAKAHNVSTVQIALKWITKQQIPLVTKSSSEDHLAQDLDLWSWDITDDELSALNNHKPPKFSINNIPSYACDRMADAVLV